MGERLALAARRVAYGEALEASGPAFRRARVEGGRMVVEFAPGGGGLAVRGDGRLGGFAVAGPDRRFVWAQAAIEGDRVVVWSPAVAHPVAVRYAWGNNPEGANLVSRAGLPAAPFRSDGW